jgi:hypothetical protein
MGTAETITSLHQKFLRIADLDPFDGTKTKYTTFCRQVQVCLVARPDLFKGTRESDQNAILFAISHMRGGMAEEWANEFLEKAAEDGTFGTWKDFTDRMDATFKDVNASAKARHRLETMRQERRTAEDFFLEFESTFRRAGFNTRHHDDVLVGYLEKNLHPAIVDRIYDVDPLPTTYEAWKRKAIALDQLHRRRQERRNLTRDFWAAAKPTRQERGTAQEARPQQDKPLPPTPTPTTAHYHGGRGIPMEIDRTRPRTKGCYGCGDLDHLVRDCPKNRAPRTSTHRIESLEEVMRRRDELEQELSALKMMSGTPLETPGF